MTTNDRKYGAEMFKYTHVLKAPSGQYYTGKAGERWLGPKAEAFTYTEQGAHMKTQINQFKKFTVEALSS